MTDHEPFFRVLQIFKGWSEDKYQGEGKVGRRGRVAPFGFSYLIQKSYELQGKGLSLQKYP